MPARTVRVPHLGGITVGYQNAKPLSQSKPTLILVNSFMTSSDLYASQFANSALADTMNLVAIELLGHGQTRTTREHWTYWDTAIMNIQVMDALGIKKAFVLGTSQGGWITVRMALIAPERIAGIIPLGTSMDSESERSRKLGCWSAAELLGGFLDSVSTTETTPSFATEGEFVDGNISLGFGTTISDDNRAFWQKTIKTNYAGDDGRKRARMATINLLERDGLHRRLADVKCPVLWLHGTEDKVYSVANAQEEIKLFTGSVDAKLVTVENGAHFLSASNPKEINEAVLEFVGRLAKGEKPDARALREAVGMVEM